MEKYEMRYMALSPIQCHRTSVDVLKGRLSVGRMCEVPNALSLVTSVRFMSFPLNFPHLSCSRSYSAVYIPDKKLVVPIF